MSQLSDQQPHRGARARPRPRTTVGWREWVGLPDLGVPFVKAKLDTGARTSALHAFGINYFEEDGKPMVRFEIHPVQRDSTVVITAAAQLAGERTVRSSNGRAERRPVIVTRMTLTDGGWPIELTLTRRDLMGFRMIIGRQALRQRLIVDPSRSFLAGSPTTAVTDGEELRG